MKYPAQNSSKDLRTIRRYEQCHTMVMYDPRDLEICVRGELEDVSKVRLPLYKHNRSVAIMATSYSDIKPGRRYVNLYH